MKAEMKFSIWVILLTLISTSCSSGDDSIETPPPPPVAVVETFTFSSNGNNLKGKIYLPASHKTNNNLPTIYLIDYQETHFTVATDEFDQVINGVKKIAGFDALVVTLNEHLQINPTTGDFEEHYNLFKDMTSYVENTFTNNTSRTFIGRGSEAGVVLMTLLQENPDTSIFDNFIATGSPGSFNSTVINILNNENFPDNVQNKKLHFSYDTADDPGVVSNNLGIELINKIEEKQYAWLKFESKGYTQNFETAYPFAYAAGIKFVFDK